nr:hypothetical protein [Ruegeria sp. THAF57]
MPILLSGLLAAIDQPFPAFGLLSAKTAQLYGIYKSNTGVEHQSCGCMRDLASLIVIEELCYLSFGPRINSIAFHIKWFCGSDRIGLHPLQFDGQVE